MSKEYNDVGSLWTSGRFETYIHLPWKPTDDVNILVEQIWCELHSRELLRNLVLLASVYEQSLGSSFFDLDALVSLLEIEEEADLKS